MGISENKINVNVKKKVHFANDLLPDGHGELSRSTLTLSDQKSSTLPVSESTFCHTARYTTGKPAGDKKEKKRKMQMR